MYLSRNYILNYLATRPNLESYVIQALVTLLSKITKYGLFDYYKEELIFRNVVEDAITLSEDDLPIPTRKSLKTEEELIEILTSSIHISDNE